MKIGRRLKHLRESAEYDIEDMAVAMGVKSYTIRRYENDERSPDYDTLVWYAKTFCVTVDYILGYQLPIISSATDIPIDYSRWDSPTPEELQNEYIVAAFVRLGMEYSNMKTAFENLRRLTEEITDKQSTEENVEDEEI